MGSSESSVASRSSDKKSNKIFSSDLMGQNQMHGGEYVRRAHHSGSWYESSSSALDKTLGSFLKDAEDNMDTMTSEIIPRAIIAPHAGYSYSGSTAAYAYRALGEALASHTLKTIVVLHPSHHVRLNGCSVSGENTR